MAIMPHPERTLNGDPIFQSMRDYILDNALQRAEQVKQTVPLSYYPRRIETPVYKKPAQTTECIVELMITDNHALTVQNTLRQHGLPVIVKRQVHWEIHCDSPETIQKIKQSGVLYNERKEMEVQPNNNTAAVYLVRAKEDLIGQQKRQTLQDHFSLRDIRAICHGVLWQFSSQDLTMTELQEKILQTNVVMNPYAHDCYRYR